MTDPAIPDGRRRRLIITLTAASLILLVLTGVGIYGLIAGPPSPSPQGTDHPSTPATPTPSSSASPASELPALPETTDPRRFTTAAAETLFTWDTFTTLGVEDHRAVLLEAADPTGTETPGLIADLDNYLPTAETWRQLSEYRTAQSIEIDRVFVPEQWHEAVAAAEGQIAEGLTAYTVEATRHRTGVWFDEPVESAHPVAFTVFLSCPPATDTCVLLRLSQLDNPLR